MAAVQATYSCSHMVATCSRCHNICHEPTTSQVGDHDYGKYEDEDDSADTVDWKAITSARDAAEITRTWPTGTRKTRRYFHGMLSYMDHIHFLTAWRAEGMTNGHGQTKKSKKRGEIFQIRGAMRMKYAGWFVSLNTVRAALKTRPEWNEWTQELLSERKEKLEVQRQKKTERKEQAVKAEQRAKGKEKRKAKAAKRLAAKSSVNN